MSSNRIRRITKELGELSRDPHSTVKIEVVREDITNLRGSFTGPDETPYEGGTYYIDIKIPQEYPFKPPTMKFETKIWHPNVSSVTGAICLDTLSSNWSPVLTIKSALIMLQSLLSTPEPRDPQDAEVANMLLRSPADYEHKAREWAVQFAGAPHRRLTGSGVSQNAETAKKAHDDAKAAEKDKKERENKDRLAEYKGYNPALVDRFCDMGFQVRQVVSAFEYVGIDRNDGEDYELEEAYMGDITARLFNEP